MITFRVTRDKLAAEVTIDADYHDAGEIKYTGGNAFAEWLERRLPEMYGHYGHTLGTIATPADLDYALQENKALFDSITLIDGTVDKEPIRVPDKAIP